MTKIRTIRNDFISYFLTFKSQFLAGAKIKIIIASSPYLYSKLNLKLLLLIEKPFFKAVMFDENRIRPKHSMPIFNFSIILKFQLSFIRLQKSLLNTLKGVFLKRCYRPSRCLPKRCLTFFRARSFVGHRAELRTKLRHRSYRFESLNCLKQK